MRKPRLGQISDLSRFANVRKARNLAQAVGLEFLSTEARILLDSGLINAVSHEHEA